MPRTTTPEALSESESIPPFTLPVSDPRDVYRHNLPAELVSISELNIFFFNKSISLQFQTSQTRPAAKIAHRFEREKDDMLFSSLNTTRYFFCGSSFDKSVEFFNNIPRPLKNLM